MARGRWSGIGLGLEAIGAGAMTVWQTAGYATMAVGTGILLWQALGWYNDRREAKGRARLKLEPSHLIWAGLAGMVISVLLVAAGLIWQQNRLSAQHAETLASPSPSSPVQPLPKKYYSRVELDRRKEALVKLNELLIDKFDPALASGQSLTGERFAVLGRQGPSAYNNYFGEFREQYRLAQIDLDTVLKRYDYDDIASAIGRPPSIAKAVEDYGLLLSLLEQKPFPNYYKLIPPQRAYSDFQGALEGIKGWLQTARENLKAKRREYDAAEVRE